MKAIFLALLCVTGALARSGQVIQAEGPSCPIADPLFVVEGALNISLNPLFTIDEGATHGDLVVDGLSTLWYDVGINAVLLTATFHVKVPSMDMVGTYDATGYIDARPLRDETVPGGNFTGSGEVAVSARNLELRGSATLFINIIGNKVTVRLLNILQLTFDSIAVDLSDAFIIGGHGVDWAAWSSSFKANFDQDFRGNTKTDFVDKIREAANNIVGQFTLAELIDLIGGGGDGSTPAPCETLP